VGVAQDCYAPIARWLAEQWRREPLRELR
jgi:hypothetical protein